MLIVIMGVSGAGKTTVGCLLAERLGFAFLEGDRFHPQANVAKMQRGEPLDDADRWPWLDRLAAELRRARNEGHGLVLTCSALKRTYRERLRAGAPELRFVWLDGDRSVIRARLGIRKGHFMPPALLESQFTALEEPGPEESVLRVSIDREPAEIVAEIMRAISVSHSPTPTGSTKSDSVGY
jgi:carbohydrate kinase (thermoresistant glucokinase family)